MHTKYIMSTAAAWSDRRAEGRWSGRRKTILWEGTAVDIAIHFVLCAIKLPLLTQIKEYHHLEEKEKRDQEAFVKRTSNYKTLQVSEEVLSYVD